MHKIDPWLQHVEATVDDAWDMTTRLGNMDENKEYETEKWMEKRTVRTRDTLAEEPHFLGYTSSYVPFFMQCSCATWGRHLGTI